MSTLKKAEPHKRHAVLQELRTLARTLAPGDRIPSAPQIARQFGVAAGTAQAALNTLTEEGSLVRRRGSGTFIAPAGKTAAPPAASAPAPANGPVAILALYQNAFFDTFTDYIQRRAAEEDVPALCRYARQIAPDEAIALQSLNPAAFVLVGSELHPVARLLQSRGARVVLLGEPYIGEQFGVASIGHDSEEGGYLATRHLLRLGHRRLLYVHPHDSSAALTRKRRWRGHERALREFHLPDAAVTLVERGAGWGGDKDAVRAAFATEADSPTAALIWSDAYVPKFLQTLQQVRPLRVPEDFSVIGYDNMPETASLPFGLDTIDPHFEVQINYLFSFLREPMPPQGAEGVLPTPAVIAAPTLVARGSCAPPSSLSGGALEPPRCSQP